MSSNATPNMEKLFGTDGIRGIANQYPMTPEVGLQLGKAVARYFRNADVPRVVVGKDTRLSGYLFENAVTAGLLAAGATVFLVGPLPTPAVAHITRSFGADAGIMITASHNPASHNGLKLFNKDGYKLSDAAEEEIEKIMINNLGLLGKDNNTQNIGKAIRIDDARGRYIEFAKGTIGSISLKGLTIVLDCANGAAYHIAPTIFSELGATIIKIGVTPDGMNINDGVGALYPEKLATLVKENNADIGIALDGDADRVVLVDEKGTILNGDHILAIAGKYLKEKNELQGKTVVGTPYTNQALDELFLPLDIAVIRVGNGDRYVIEEMAKNGYSLGGEQSGHIIFHEFATTGDGTISALQILKIMTQEKKKLSELASILCLWPQKTTGIEVTEKIPIEKTTKLQEAITQVESKLGSQGRVLVRYSGTEMKLRIMVEAKDLALVDECSKTLETAAKEELA